MVFRESKYRNRLCKVDKKLNYFKLFYFLFSKYNISEGWDGTQQKYNGSLNETGTPVNSGIYFYLLSAIGSGNEPITEHGNIALIR